MKPWLKLLDDPRLPQIAIVGLLLIMAALTPRLMYGWIDEFWIVNYGQNIFGHTEIEPQHSLYWGGACLSALFHEWFPGMFGQRWVSWLSSVGMALAALRLGRLMNLNRTTAAWLVVLLLLSPEVRFEGQNGRVDNLAMMWVFLALGQTHLALTSSPRHAWTAGALSVVAVWTWITAVVPLLALLPLLWHHRSAVNGTFFARSIGGGLLVVLAVITIAPGNAMAGMEVLLEHLRWRWDEGAENAVQSIPPNWRKYSITLSLGAAMIAGSGISALRSKPLHIAGWTWQLGLGLFALWLTVRTHLYHARIVYWIYLIVATSFIALQADHSRPKTRAIALHPMLLIALVFGIGQGPKLFFSIRHALRKPPLELALRERIAHLNVQPGMVVATFSREYAPFVEEAGATPVLGEKSWPGADLVIGSQYGPAGEVIEAAGFERVVWPESFEKSARFHRLPDVYKPAMP